MWLQGVYFKQTQRRGGGRSGRCLGLLQEPPANASRASGAAILGGRGAPTRPRPQTPMVTPIYRPRLLPALPPMAPPSRFPVSAEPTALPARSCRRPSPSGPPPPPGASRPRCRTLSPSPGGPDGGSVRAARVAALAVHDGAGRAPLPARGGVGGEERGQNGGCEEAGDASLLPPPPPSRWGVRVKPRGSAAAVPSAPREFARCGPCLPPRVARSRFPRSPSGCCCQELPQLRSASRCRCSLFRKTCVKKL